MIDPTQDGITHINVYSQGKTELGRMLSNFYPFVVNTPDGFFDCVESYWYWLSIEDCEEKESLRKLSGYTAKQAGKLLEKNFNAKVDPHFKVKILNAVWYKARRNKDLFVPEYNELPFEHYYNYSGKIVDVKEKHIWLIDGITTIRDHIIYDKTTKCKIKI